MADFEPWRNKEKKKQGFNIYFDFDKIEELMDGLMKDMLEENKGLEEARPKKPLVMGFNLKFNEEGRPTIEGFGNIKAMPGKKVSVQLAREPLVDVIDSEKMLSITAELPGVEEKDISLKVEENSVEIEVGKPASFYKKIELKAAINPQTAKTSLKNGIFELTAQKLGC